MAASITASPTRRVARPMTTSRCGQPSCVRMNSQSCPSTSAPVDPPIPGPSAARARRRCRARVHQVLSRPPAADHGAESVRLAQERDRQGHRHEELQQAAADDRHEAVAQDAEDDVPRPWKTRFGRCGSTAVLPGGPSRRHAEGPDDQTGKAAARMTRVAFVAAAAPPATGGGGGIASTPTAARASNFAKTIPQCAHSAATESFAAPHSGSRSRAPYFLPDR